MPSEARLLVGRDSLPAERRLLRAGPLTVELDPANAALRYLRLGNRELLRGIYGAVRDRNWGTVAPRLENLTIDEVDGGFRVTFTAQCRQDDIDFVWDGLIEGTTVGMVRYTFDGGARRTFWRNRIGLCVLHPLTCAGRPCHVSHIDGTVTEAAFPALVAPDQPFMDIEAITHWPDPERPALQVEVTFEGEVFEMEDQRNWTDASFKTYSTPLDLPYPVEVLQATRYAQVVTVQFAGFDPAWTVPPAAPETVALHLSPEPVGAWPRLGFGAGEGGALSDEQASLLRALRPHHLRVEVAVGQPRVEDQLRQAWQSAQAVGARLELAVRVDTGGQPEALTQALQAVQPDLAWCLLLTGGRDAVAIEDLQRWVPALRAWREDVAVGAGTDAYFAELNRQPPPLGLLDRVAYSINPQVHAFDDDSLMETLPAQGETVRSARALAQDCAVAVTPITLRPRYNPNATAETDAVDADGLSPTVDPRQAGLFTAAWTVGSLKHLAEAGADSVTYFELLGPRGLLMGDSALPGFAAEAGDVFPVHHVFATVAGCADAQVLPCASSRSRAVEALVLRQASDQLLALVANLTVGPQMVRLDLPAPRSAAQRRRLNTHTVALDKLPVDACAATGTELHLDLLPYEVTILAWPPEREADGDVDA